VLALTAKYPRKLIVAEIQSYLRELRHEISGGMLLGPRLDSLLRALPGEIESRLAQSLAPALRKVINATGVILHTNIGRAPMAAQAFDSIRDLACSYSNLEFDLGQGERSRRDKAFEARLRRLVACEAATVVNNNAAAVFLILNTLAAGKTALVSRGELVEIGGSFRIPDIMRQSGAILQEVGTTNKTTITDYREALDDSVALILRVHPSNYKIVGFTARPRLGDLAKLAAERGIPLVKDAGSGYLYPIEHQALANEPSVEGSLAAGADLVCFSGDKLLGGPQAGVIVGCENLVERIRRNPLMRICRVDKLTYAALEWVLTEYEKGTYRESLPIYRMLLAPRDEVAARAERLAARLREAGFDVEIVNGYSLVGGGSAPQEKIPTALLAVTARDQSSNALERALRASQPAVLARIEEDRLVLDLRTALPGEDDLVFNAFAALSASSA
jgi:L-seryl-tRNA(Ser) seleniumtransferase